MGSKLRSELDALKRANRRLAQELSTKGSYKDAPSVAPLRRDRSEKKLGNRSADDAWPEPTVDQVDNAAVECESSRHPEVETIGSISPASSAPGSGIDVIALRLEAGLERTSEVVERLSSSIGEDLCRQHEELIQRLEQLEESVDSLRVELTSTPVRRPEVLQEEEVDHRLLLRPLKAREHEITVSHTIDEVQRQAEPPSYYLPLLLGTALITIVLISLLFIAN